MAADSIRCGCAGVHARLGRASMSARSALLDSGRRHRSTRAPMARPASTSVVQCASRTIRVAAMRPPKSPGDRRGLRIGPRDRRRDRAHVHGMARRKGIVGLARAGNATAAPMDHAPIRPFLVDQPLQQMRQDGGRPRCSEPDDRAASRRNATAPWSKPSSRDKPQPLQWFPGPLFLQ